MIQNKPMPKEIKIKRYLISTNRLFEELPFYQVRDLKPEEKNKSLDYWEGYTKAVRELTNYLNNYAKTKENN